MQCQRKEAYAVAHNVRVIMAMHFCLVLHLLATFARACPHLTRREAGRQVAHVTEGVKFIEADAHGRVPHGWAEAQVLASADFAHGSWLWTHFSGGLNYQAGNPVFQPCQINPKVRKPCNKPPTAHASTSC